MKGVRSEGQKICVRQRKVRAYHIGAKQLAKGDEHRNELSQIVTVGRFDEGRPIRLARPASIEIKV